MSAQTIALILMALIVALGAPAGVGPDAHRVDTVETTAATPGEQSSLFVLGYAMQDGRQTAQQVAATHQDVIAAVAPWSWGLTKDGRLRPVYFREAELGQLLMWAGRHGVETHLLIHNFDPEGGAFDPSIADAVLVDGPVRRTAVESIARTAQSWGVTGVHIDFEGVPARRRDDLTAFVHGLRKRLDGEGIGLSMAVPAITFSTADAPWTRGYDYRRLAEHVDFLMVMAYDEHWAGSSPGPVASLPWVEEVIGYALHPSGGAVPPERLVLGLAGYGYDWPLKSRVPGEAVTYAEAFRRLHEAQRLGAAAKLDWHEQYAAPYIECGDRIIWFENASSLWYKLQLAQQHRLRGVALWRLGQEDPQLWPLLRALN